MRSCTETASVPSEYVRAGQLNLMTAGRGVAHSEEATGSYRGELHGIQLWVAQPEATRNGPAAFEHTPTCRRSTSSGGTATVIVGDSAGACRRRGATPTMSVSISRYDPDGPSRRCGPTTSTRSSCSTARSGPGRSSSSPVTLRTWARAAPDHARRARAHTGDVARRRPFAEQLLMWWNFVARTTGEVDAAHESWRGNRTAVSAPSRRGWNRSRHPGRHGPHTTSTIEWIAPAGTRSRPAIRPRGGRVSG